MFDIIDIKDIIDFKSFNQKYIMHFRFFYSGECDHLFLAKFVNITCCWQLYRHAYA